MSPSVKLFNIYKQTACTLLLLDTPCFGWSIPWLTNSGTGVWGFADI